MKASAVIFLCLLGMTIQACTKTNADSAAANAASPDPNASAATPAPPPPVVIPAGTVVRVRLDETIDTKRNRSGDRFTATLDEPLVSGDRVIVPVGVVFNGHVTQAKPSGRFKGRAVLALKLDSFDLDGRNYAVDSVHSQVSGGHKRRNWSWIGGTSAGGAVIGGAAAGGPGALIGAGAGAAAGTVGAAFTGKREVSLPVESRLAFNLHDSVEVSD